jgi:hypothetical protein
MAAPTFVALGIAAGGNAAVTPGAPAGSVQDDIWLCYVQTSNENAAAVPTATNLTFVEVTNSPQGAGTAATAGAVGLRVYWARRGATAPGTVTVPDSGNHTVAQIAAYRGCAPTGNPWDITLGSTTGSIGAQFNFPSLTTTVSDCMVVFIGANPSDSATCQFDSSNFNFSTGPPPPNTTSNTARNTVGDGSNIITGTGGGVQSFDGVLATAGATGAFTLFAQSTNVNSAMLIIALKPSAPVVPLPSLITQPLTPARRR